MIGTARGNRLLRELERDPRPTNRIPGGQVLQHLRALRARGGLGHLDVRHRGGRERRRPQEAGGEESRKVRGSDRMRRRFLPRSLGVRVKPDQLGEWPRERERELDRHDSAVTCRGWVGGATNYRGFAPLAYVGFGSRSRVLY